MHRTFNSAVLETKQAAYNLELKSLSDSGVFSGYASVFSVVDNHKDLILPGAFRRTLEETKGIKLLWQHRTDEPIGTFTHIEEDSHGLYVEGRLLLDIQRAREAHALLKSGAIEGMSIGYTPREYSYDPDTGVRILHDIDLWEVSLVTFPANQAAEVTHVKHSPEGDQELAELEGAMTRALSALVSE